MWLRDFAVDGWHQRPLNEVVEALAPNILVQYPLFFIMGQVFTMPFLHVCDLRSFGQIFVSRWLNTLQTWLKLSNHWFDYHFCKSCVEIPLEFAASNSTHMPSSCCCLSTLSCLCNSAFSSWHRFLSFFRFFLVPDWWKSLIIYPFLFLFCSTWRIQSFLWPLPAGLFCYLSRDLLGLPRRLSCAASNAIKPVGHVCCILYCLLFLVFLEIMGCLCLFVTDDLCHSMLLDTGKYLSSLFSIFAQLRCTVVYLIPGDATRRGPSIQQPWMLFEHGIGP